MTKRLVDDLADGESVLRPLFDKIPHVMSKSRIHSIDDDIVGIFESPCDFAQSIFRAALSVTMRLDQEIRFGQRRHFLGIEQFFLPKIDIAQHENFP